MPNLQIRSGAKVEDLALKKKRSIKKIFFCVVVLVLAYHVPSYGDVLCIFKGNFDSSEKKINLDIRFKDKSSIVAQLVKTQEDHFNFQGKVDHLKTPIFDISSIVEGSIEFLTDPTTGERYPKGTMESKYSLVNYKPTHELSGNFEIKKERLYLKSLSWAGIVLDGYLGLLPPFDIDLDIKLSDITNLDIPDVSTCKENDKGIKGEISGDIDLSGFTDHLLIRGRLRALDGSIGDTNYESLILDFEGTYPMVHIADSTITNTDGLSFNLEGYFDLTKQCDASAALTALKMSPVIDATNVHRDWTIKRKQETGSSATEFKYRLQTNNNDMPASKNETDMLSIGHNIKF